MLLAGLWFVKVSIPTYSSPIELLQKCGTHSESGVYSPLAGILPMAIGHKTLVENPVFTIIKSGGCTSCIAWADSRELRKALGISAQGGEPYDRCYEFL